MKRSRQWQYQRAGSQCRPMRELHIEEIAVGGRVELSRATTCSPTTRQRAPGLPPPPMCQARSEASASRPIPTMRSLASKPSEHCDDAGAHTHTHTLLLSRTRVSFSNGYAKLIHTSLSEKTRIKPNPGYRIPLRRRSTTSGSRNCGADCGPSSILRATVVADTHTQYVA